MIQEKKDEHGEKYLSVETEDDWHEALRRGWWVETPVQLAEQIGVPMNEDVVTLADIIAAGADRWRWPPFLSLWGKFGTSYARRVTDELEKPNPGYGRRVRYALAQFTDLGLQLRFQLCHVLPQSNPAGITPTAAPE